MDLHASKNEATYGTRRKTDRESRTYIDATRNESVEKKDCSVIARNNWKHQGSPQRDSRGFSIAQ